MTVKHKLCCCAMVVALCGFALHADDGFTIEKHDGTSQQFTITPETKILFEDGGLVVVDADGEYQLDIADITQIRFDVVATSVKSLESKLSDDVMFKNAAGVVTISSLSGAPLTIGVYSIKGVCVHQQSGVQSDVIDFNAMQSGVYIIKANNKIIKYVK